MKCCSEGHYHVEGVGVLDGIEMDHIVELLCVCEGIHRYLLFHESLLSFRLSIKPCESIVQIEHNTRPPAPTGQIETE